MVLQIQMIERSDTTIRHSTFDIRHSSFQSAVDICGRLCDIANFDFSIYQPDLHSIAGG